MDAIMMDFLWSPGGSSDWFFFVQVVDLIHVLKNWNRQIPVSNQYVSDCPALMKTIQTLTKFYYLTSSRIEEATNSWISQHHPTSSLDSLGTSLLALFFGGFPEIDAHQSTFPAGSFEGIASEEPATWADTAKHCWGSRSSKHRRQVVFPAPSLTLVATTKSAQKTSACGGTAVRKSLTIWVTLWGSPILAQPQLLRPFRLRLFEPIGSWPARACHHDL